VDGLAVVERAQLSGLDFSASPAKDLVPLAVVRLAVDQEDIARFAVYGGASGRL